MKNNVNDNWLGTCRGIAVVGVLLTHFLPYINDTFELNSRLIKGITVEVIDTGKVGVALLFLIAGYLAPSSKRRRNVKQFAVNRFFRLYPVYWLSIILVGILFDFDGYGLDTIVANFTMLQVFFMKEDLVGLFWTLPIELMLYVGAVFLERFMWEHRKLYILEVIGCAGTIFLGIVRKVFWTTAPVAIGLLLTIALVGQTCRLYKNSDIDLKQLTISMFTFCISLLISCLLAYQVDTGYHENWHRYVLSYVLAIVIFCFFMTTEANLKAFTSLAIIAYPVYLLQEVIFRVAFSEMWHTGMSEVVFSFLTLSTLGGLSILAHILIEKPMVVLGNTVENKLAL